MTMAQGISLPYAQAGAMATVPALAGTAAGIGVFVQNFLGAGFAHFCGWKSDSHDGNDRDNCRAGIGVGRFAIIAPALKGNIRTGQSNHPLGGAARVQQPTSRIFWSPADRQS